jgi:radical SAM protein (TIGR01212 family)
MSSPNLESRISNLELFPGGKRYNAYGPFLKSRFGCRVYKVSVDGGFTCPNRDGTVAMGGCAYCSNDSFRPETASRLKPIPEQVKEGIDYLRKRYGAAKFIAYFQPFTNTHGPLQALIPLYEAALAHPDVVGLSVGTRPDCVDESKIAWFERLARTHFVVLEYGLQSIYDTTLERINRGHDYRCWLEAMDLSRNRGIRLGAHLILGFPWETREAMLKMADVLSDKGLDFLKLHHLHVVRNTAMASEYLRNPFPLFSLEDYADLVVDFLERLNPAICIERLSGFAPEEQLIGPIWSKSKGGIQRQIEQRLAARNTYQGRLYQSIPPNQPIFR